METSSMAQLLENIIRYLTYTKGKKKPKKITPATWKIVNLLNQSQDITLLE